MTATLDVHRLLSAQLDALREVASIGAGHAATALSTMTGQSIMINVPTISVARLADLPSRIVAHPDDAVAVVVMGMHGDLTGRALLAFPAVAACRLAEIMLRRPRGSSPALAALEQSALKECGNILSGAYLNALADFMQFRLLPSPPQLAVDHADAVFGTAVVDGDGSDVVFCVESEFLLRDDGQALRGYFLLLPDAGSLQRILQAVKLA